MLSHLRVLDLTDGGATIAGRLLADMGAEVILVEPPGGIELRRRGPFVDDRPDPESSLAFWATNHSKSSVVVDLETETGRDELRRLAAGADLLIESRPVGSLAAIGLGYDDLAKVNPALVVVSISPFGATGPKARWAAHDLTVEAASGAMAMTGDADRPPCQLSSVPQGFLHAGIDAVVGALVALTSRNADGHGRHVDISAQTSAMLCAQQQVLSHAWGDLPVTRAGGAIVQGGVRYRVVYPARDGWVSVTLLFGPTFGDFSRRLVELVCDADLVPASVLDADFATFGVELREGLRPISDLDVISDGIAELCRRHTTAELARLAADHRLLLVPVSTVADVRGAAQLSARDYWQPVHHLSLGRSVHYPGPFARFSATPIGPRRRPPLLGEHTATIAARPATGTIPAPAAEPRHRPLDGLKILDFTWVMAGPMAVRYLTDAGATVVHIESSARPDSLRAVTPFPNGVPDPDCSGVHANLNCDKLALSLDLRCPEARDIVRMLVQWADAVVENYSPKAMRGWGLDYESLAEERPDLVMVSSCLNGQTGPEAAFAGYGTMGMQMAGFGALAGWPDRDPAGPFGAYTDYCAPRFTAAALLAALEHRRRTGEGQYVDLSQTEASLHLLGPAFLDLEVNGRVAERVGNDSPGAAPHGVYPCRGDDRWVAIVAATNDHWAALCETLGRDDWAADPTLAELPGRLAARRRLDDGIASWTTPRSVGEVEETLVAAGVPVHGVLQADDVTRDPQLLAREHLVWVDHPVLDGAWVENSRLRISDADTRPRRGGLRIGEHNDEVLRKILGLDAATIDHLDDVGALR